MTEKRKDAEPIPPANWGHSETAATVGKELYGPSGAMTYRVRLEGAGRAYVDVVGLTGDEAAAKALAEFGGKVVHVDPAPQKADA